MMIKGSRRYQGFKWVDVVGLELAMGLHHDGWDDGGSERRGASHCGTV